MVTPGTVTWHSPNGTVWDLTDPDAVLTLDGPAGHGAPPKDVTRAPLYAGGTRVTHRRVDERILTWPLHVHADTHDGFLDRWRSLTEAFVCTERFGAGRFRITRIDGSWREVMAEYLDGLTAEDQNAQGYYHRVPVVQLVCPDPFWYGPETKAVAFEYGIPRDFLNPYPTVDYGNRLGTKQIDVAGERPSWPTWVLVGPFSSATISTDDASFSFNAAMVAGERITIVTDPSRFSVTDQDGANRVGDLSWPTAEPFPLVPGRSTVYLELSGAAEGAAIEMIYRPRWETA